MDTLTLSDSIELQRSAKLLLALEKSVKLIRKLRGIYLLISLNLNIFSTIPVQPIEQPAIDAQQLQVPIQMIAARQRNLRNGIGAAIQQQQNVFNFNAQVALAMNVAMPPRPDRARPRREPILPRYRIVSLVNDLTCVGIPEAIGKLEVYYIKKNEKLDFYF